MENPKTFNLDVKFNNQFEDLNSGFKKGTCLIAYAGKNRNGSDIPKESFEDALPSLKLIPIVGNFKDGNFGGHDVAINLEGNGVSFVDLTSPIGVVPENHNAQWVDVEDENGNIKKYLQCDVIFWYSRFPEPVKFIENNGFVNQSMEIVVKDGVWDENYTSFKITSMEFEALCLLGTSDDSNINVDPCFEDSKVQFNLNHDEFKLNFSTMLEELKTAYFVEKEVSEIKDEIIKEEFTEEIEEQVQEDTESFEEENVEDSKDENVEDYTAKITELENYIKELESKVDELTEFKMNTLKEQREQQEVELFEKFDMLFSEEDEDYKTIKENKDTFATVEQLEEKIALIYTRKQMQFSMKKADGITRIGSEEQNTGEVSPYGNLFEKHGLTK